MGDAGSVTEGVLADLREEGEALDRLVAGLDAEAWARPTPAPRWSIAHQIAHLAWTDEQVLKAATDEAAFRDDSQVALASPGTFVDEGAEAGAALPPARLLERWRAGRAEVLRVLGELPQGRRVPWYGPAMSAASMATARIMETWAHGEDVAGALGVTREPTERLRHVVRIGVRARDFAYAVRGLQPPGEPFRVELEGPDGQLWAHGPEDAAQRVTGDAVGFCLLVTQRIHRDDADVRAQGADAQHWLEIAQAFAGPPGEGRARREVRR
ncbi:TIGR03084 family metal-binding protein [Streptomyces nanshensis]|uniref:Wyosine base formation domain-containing protein n=1 Tax=Streptomyces nanshensis TaxID=518642 RepID=A0A1E7L7S7_9ACTN|nr:TIGR03084 family metal-binding protein [Streptomyces nanshensis]OEV12229.1 wyosine base formation domain-containing protein [Streptomyces nanshensis]